MCHRLSAAMRSLSLFAFSSASQTSSARRFSWAIALAKSRAAIKTTHAMPAIIKRLVKRVVKFIMLGCVG